MSEHPKPVLCLRFNPEQKLGHALPSRTANSAIIGRTLNFVYLQPTRMLAHATHMCMGGVEMQGSNTVGGSMHTTIPGVVACGMDVHRDHIEVCVRAGDGSPDGVVSNRSFSTMRKALLELRDWLVSMCCFNVLMESTSVYWVPMYNILEEDERIHIGVGNSRDLKNAPGRPKTDKEDAKWLSRLCMFGMVLKSFIVPRAFRELREYTRYHRKLVQERARHVNRIEKLLQINGFKLSSVLSDITGASGTRILTKLADTGQLSVNDIRAALDRNCKHTPEEIECAINGALKATSRWLLKLQLQRLARCGQDIDEVYQAMLDISKEHAAAIRIIASIPGMSTQSAIDIIAEIGTDLSAFPTANHLAAWAGLAPKENESAGKVRPSRTKKANPYVKSLLVQCAWAATKTRGTRLSIWYWRNHNRLGNKKAITAVARKLLCYIYAMLKSGKPYDKSLDTAYTRYSEVIKLDAAVKTIGNRKGNDQRSATGSGETVGHHATHASRIVEATGARTPLEDQSEQVVSGIGAQPSEPQPKKRGRPRKIDQAVNGIGAQVPELQPKKRGRPRKIDQVVNGIEAQASEPLPKKRGRPKKAVATE